MSQRNRRHNVVSCGNCGANFDARGEDPRCPACDARVADYEPGEARPSIRGYGYGELEGPDLLYARRDDKPETAPPEDFIAAGLVLLAFILIVAGIAVRSPDLLLGGMALFALAGIAFGLYKLYLLATGRRKKREDSFEGPSMMDWLIGRGFWDRWR